MNSEYILLRINLTTQNTTTEEIPFGFLKKYIGGKGLGSKYLLDEIKPKIDPLGPENKLIFVAGPVTATMFPTGNRYGILYKSPLTGTYAESYSGGGAVQKMRAAGYFMIIIEGKSKNHTYIHITEDGVKFHDASQLWGLDTFETYHALEAGSRRDLDILCIGPAGENLVRIANVQNNLYHSAGRCGPGAIMGSKNLKAIVFSGNGRPELNNKPEFKILTKKIHKLLNDNPKLYGNEGLYKKYGTPSIVDWVNELGCFPTRYFTACYSEFSQEINAQALNEKILKKNTGCWNCPINCGKYVEVEEGPFQCAVEGPEYETIATFGGMCDVRNIAAIAKINEYCDRMGIDTISAGSICGLAIEAKRRGRLPGSEQLNIDYNKPLEILKFLENIVYKRGIGKIFAEGTRFIAEKFNLEDIAMHVKGLDFAGYDPRAFRGFAISYGVAPEGPTHLRSVYHGVEKGLPNYLEYDNKIAPMLEQEDRMAIIDSLIVCKFIRGILNWDVLVEIYNVLYDTSIDMKDLRKIAAEMVTMSRKFNIREGLNRKDDYMPDRVYKEELINKYGSKISLDRDKYDLMLDEYYDLRGWNRNGIPKI
ncbi:MAG: aldehyde ferredoxin oxidoreductase family protein [archaeon]|nr:aldehyde ferredoxin oxidoreductase family protein [archaeon]